MVILVFLQTFKLLSTILSCLNKIWFRKSNPLGIWGRNIDITNGLLVFTKWCTTNDKHIDLIYKNVTSLLPFKTHLLHKLRHRGLPNRWLRSCKGNLCDNKFITSTACPREGSFCYWFYLSKLSVALKGKRVPFCLNQDL